MRRETATARPAAAVAEALHLDNAHDAIQSHGHNVADPDRLARSRDPPAIEPDVARIGQRDGVAPRADDARVP